jgi:predicted  nucleic acid-binding Zn-ribbon protein
MSRPFKLYRLQQIDSQLDWMLKRLNEIDEALKEDEALQKAKSEAERSEKGLLEAQKKLRQAEELVKQQRIKIEQSESMLYSGKVTNPKELEDLQNEATSLKRYLSVLEDRQLEAMLAEEEATSCTASANQELEIARQRFEKRSEELNAEKNKLHSDVSRFKTERETVANSIQAEDLTLYTLIRNKRRGIAVAKVTDKACSACGSTLNSALLHAARSPNEINVCDTCGRILYAG